MYLFDLFRSFLPLRNPIGFGAADFVVLALAILLSGLLFARAALLPYLKRLAESPRAAIAVLFALGLLLRLMLLHSAPVPVPAGADDFSYILLADTVRHLRFANPPHALSQFFEAVFILQHPTYSSIYPPGQGLLLALGKVLFGTWWAGVLIASAALPALVSWMLRAWVPPIWALAGGLLAIAEFGPLCSWTNSYWGGGLSACAGCLVFGALPRLPAPRAAWLLGLGLALQVLTRPFEFLLLVFCVLGYVAFSIDRREWRCLAFTLPFLLVACLLLALQNKSVTGNWTTLPYQLSRYQYGVPTTFTFQPNPVPHNTLTPEQELDYRAQAAIHGSEPDSLRRFIGRLFERLGYTRFFLLAPLFVALPFAFWRIRDRKPLWLVASVAIFFLGTNFYPYFFAHYIAAAACLLLLLATLGLARLNALDAFAAPALLCLCGAHFVFWYAIHLANPPRLLSATRYETWDFVNHGDPEGRRAVTRALEQSPGEQLVFVHYAPEHRFGEWIANAADIDHSRVVWALDLGTDENQKLERYFPSRKTWLLEPDARPPRLTPYPAP